MSTGPLHGVKVVEVASIGPGPFAVMMLADMGAEVVRLERAGGAGLGAGSWNFTHRGRPSVGCDLKVPEGREMLLRLCESADVLIEGFRPGVMEKLGVGPDEVSARNERLVYGRMTGYGQDGPLAKVAGHDINYISIAGALGQFRRTGENPLPPINMVGDYGGGAMMLAFGVLAAVIEARSSGRGQVVDASMAEGSALLMTMIWAMREMGIWTEPGTNLLDSGAHFYDTYECKDGGFVAVGALEPQFYAELLRLLELDPAEFPQMERERWPELKLRFAEVFRGRTRDEWAELFEFEEACTTAVYGIDDAPGHPHNQARRRLHRDRRQAAAGARATLQPQRRRRTRRRPRSPPPTPTRRSPPGALPPRRSPLCATPARSAEARARDRRARLRRHSPLARSADAPLPSWIFLAYRGKGRTVAVGRPAAAGVRPAARAAASAGRAKAPGSRDRRRTARTRRRAGRRRPAWARPRPAPHPRSASR